jgi:hypothetical protein
MFNINTNNKIAKRIVLICLYNLLLLVLSGCYDGRIFDDSYFMTTPTKPISRTSSYDSPKCLEVWSENIYNNLDAKIHCPHECNTHSKVWTGEWIKQDSWNSACICCSRTTVSTRQYHHVTTHRHVTTHHTPVIIKKEVIREKPIIINRTARSNIYSNSKQCNDMSAGSIWDNNDAQNKCSSTCRHNNMTWNGHWNTTNSGDSVCGCCGAEKQVVREKPIIINKTARSNIYSNSKQCNDISAGSIWDNNDAQGKCSSICQNNNMTWNGHWNTTNSGDSVCGCCN